MRINLRWPMAALAMLATMAVPLAVITQPRPSRPVTVPAEGYDLAAYLTEGEDPRRVWVIFVHGNRAEGQEHVLYRRITGNLAEEVSVLAIDLRGFGKSSAEGLEVSNRILDRTQDIEAAVEYLRGEYGVEESQIVLMGHSLGALQVLKAGQARRYRGVVAIGPGDFQAFLQDEASRRAYAAKLSAVMGIRVPERSISVEGPEFLPEQLFTPCPQAPTALVFGAFDLEESLRRAAGEIPPLCSEMVRWVTVPLADHMYGTEWEFLPQPVRSVASWLPVGLLLWDLSRLVPLDAG